ncbi:MAG: hypothetical protein PHC64_06550 [Candidatus Gastranaerophilales bacterium]|nr:hypothetical protein [Candidatus Gastranaerophilales bacterium]
MLNSVSFCGGVNPEMVRIFFQDAKCITRGDLIPSNVAETFAEKRYARGIPRTVQYVFLPPDATFEDAGRAFDKMA